MINFAINFASFQKLLVPAHAGDLSAVEDEDEIGVQHGCRALGDEEDGAVERPQRDWETRKTVLSSVLSATRRRASVA